MWEMRFHVWDHAKKTFSKQLCNIDLTCPHKFVKSPFISSFHRDDLHAKLVISTEQQFSFLCIYICSRSSSHADLELGRVYVHELHLMFELHSIWFCLCLLISLNRTSGRVSCWLSLFS